MRSTIVLLGCMLLTPAVLAVPAFHDSPPPDRILSGMGALSDLQCVDGKAGDFDCHGVDLAAFVPLSDMGCTATGNDVWGWTDTETGREYALMGCNNGVSFVDISDPVDPVYLGRLPTHTEDSLWRDSKVFDNHAFVVSEASGHGLQVFDLTELRDVTEPPVTFAATAHNDSFGNAHNIEVNEATGFAYVVGSGQCNGGLHIIDINDPTNPQVAGCFADDGYTHDVQCVIYHGPDENYRGSEICFASNADTLTIVDVTDKSDLQMLGRETYDGVGYTHQGWLTEDHAQFLLNDELDEINLGHNTRTRVWDVADLNEPEIIGIFDSTEDATDHNFYIKGNYCYQSNYSAGLRILDLEDVADGTLVEAAYFDVIPNDFHIRHDGAGFFGTWSNYPFFDSGVVIASTIGMEGEPGGLFVTIPRLEESAIVGTVTDALAGDPLGDVHVEVTAGLPHDGSTALDGTYQIDILPGTYTVTASRPGYHTTSVSGIAVAEGEPTQADIELAPGPMAKITPDAIELEAFAGDGDSQALTITNAGVEDLTWSIETEPVAGIFSTSVHDPSLDEVLDIGEFSVDSAANGGEPVVFSLPAGVASRGDVVGLSFEGTVAGISGTSTWASDLCMQVESPGGATFAVGGFSGDAAGCNVNDWDFDGAGDDGTYESVHLDAFDPVEGDEGEWIVSFTNDWNSTGAATMTWSEVNVTLHKTSLPICQNPDDVSWLDATPNAGTTPGGESAEVTVIGDASALQPGSYEARLCVTTNDEHATLVPVSVNLEVSEMPPGEFTVDPAQLDFGQVPADTVSQTLTAELINTGPVTVTISSIDAPDAPFSRLVGDDCGEPAFDLAPEASCELAFTYSPDGDESHAAEITVMSETAEMVTLVLAGEGVVPAVGLDTNALDLGPVAPGEIADSDQVTLENVGEANLELEALAIGGNHPEEFSLYQDSCSNEVLEPGQDCSFRIRFSPDEDSVYQAVLTVSSNALDGESTIELIGRTIRIFDDRFVP